MVKWAKSFNMQSGGSKKWATHSGNPYHDKRGRFTTGPSTAAPTSTAKSAATTTVEKGESVSDYGMRHRPPGPDDDTSVPLHNLTQNGVLPDDVYTHPEYYISENETLQNWRVFNSVRGKPNKLVIIYRSLPKGHHTFNTGDWVAVRKAYARQAGMDPWEKYKDMPVIRALVPAKDIWTNGDSFDEFGYWGPPIKGVK